MTTPSAFNVIIPTANVFIHTATAVSGNHTFIDSTLTDGHPNAIILVTPNLTPGGSSAWDEHPIGVYYSGTESKWAIYNQDVSEMPVNAAFNVFVLTAGAGVFVHTATAGNRVSNYTKIDNPLTNGNPNAIVFITRNREGCSLCELDFHNTGVAYDGSQWVIFNQDSNGVLVGAAFNVLVLVPASAIFVHTVTGGDSPYTIIDNVLTNGHPKPETIAALSAIGAQIYGTDVNGTITVTADLNGYKVSLTKGGPRGPPVSTSTQGVVPTQVSTQPSQGLTVQVVSLTSPIKPGATATLSILTAPGAACTITVYYKSGASSAAGLDPKNADGSGNVSWSWKVGTTATPGTWKIVVTASLNGQTRSLEIPFVVAK